MIEVTINARDGFAAATENSVFTIINTNLTQDLVEEGFAREIISKIQQMRKQKDLEMMDHISIALMMDDQIANAVKKYKDYIMEETLATEINMEAADLDEVKINGHKTGIAIEKV